MDIDIDKVDKMKVAELRALLSSHDLDTKGTKPVLVARIKEFLESKTDEPAAQQDEAQEAAEEAPPAAAAVEAKEDEAPKAEEPMEAEAAEEPEPAEAEAEAKKEPEPEAPKPMEESAKPAAASEAPAANNDNKRGQKRKREDEPFVVTEDEPEIPDNFVCLDWFNSDLTLKINKENFVNAEPYHVAAWGYIFSSARATHGFTQGKIAFQVKWTANLGVKLEDVKEPHEMRVGWSTDDSNLQAGESPLSFAFSNFAKKANDSNFEDFGSALAMDDVVTAMVDLDSANVSFSFAKNGESLGEAFSIPKSQLEGKALFPHVSIRNVKVEANFGKNKDESEKEAFFPLQEGYVMAAHGQNPQRGMARITKRDECEMIMMIGLPASGKTTWANKHSSEQPEKRYNIIGTSTLIDRMKVNGEPRKKHMAGKWDVLISKLTKCVQDQLRLASQRRRNFILDQTNVFANAQKRKVRPFEGMQRKAIVIVPSEEDFKARTEAQEKAECKDVPDNAVMEMKANFTLPEEGDESPFKEIIFTELQREEASKLVAEYNKDAKEKGFGKRQDMPPKRRRGNFMRNQMRGRMQRGRPGPMGRGGPRGMFQRGGFPRGGMMRPMRPMGPPRGMPWRGGPMGGGNRGRGGPHGGHPRGGMGQRGGQHRPHFRGGPRGGHGGGPPPMFGGNNGGAGGGKAAPWGGPNPWQQQQQQRPPQGGGGGQWGGGNMWNQNQPMMMNQGQNHGPWGGHGGNNQRGGGNMNMNMGYGGNYGPPGGQQGYPGSQNWGGFR